MKDSADISLLLPTLNMGGAEQTVVNIANEISTDGYNVDLIVGEASGPLINDINTEVDIVTLGTSGGKLRKFSMIPYLVKYFREYRPKRLLTTMSQVNVVVVLAKELAGVNTKVILRESIHPTRNLSSLSAVESTALSSLMRLTYTRADEIIAVSSGVSSDLVDLIGFDSSNVTTIINPISPEVNRYKYKKVDHDWFNQNKIDVILSVGNMREIKDFRMLVKAYKKVYEQRNNARLCIVGDGPQYDQIQKLASKLGISDKVYLPGFIKDPYNYMYNCSVFAFPSRAEGCPNVILEALACGCQIVSTDCPSGPSEILENGEYGRLVPVGDSTAMAKGVLESLKNPICYPKINSRKKEYSLRNVTNKYENVIF